MSSRDGRVVQGGIGIDSWDIPAQPAIGDPEIQSSNTYGAALSLDEAEDIAARRLRELAIRLGDDDVEGIDSDTDSNNGTPFDADRHFRSRLALRMTGHAPDGGAERNEELPFFAVTEALPLSAFGERLAAISRQTVAALAQLAPPADTGVGSDTQASPAEAVTQVPAEASTADDDAPNYSARLSDLIAEQRLLLDRLSGLTVSELGYGRPAGSPSQSAAEGEEGDGVSSDAEQLFAAGTYPAEPLAEGADALVASTLSAEQLIAALRRVEPDTPSGTREQLIAALREVEPDTFSATRLPLYAVANLSASVGDRAGTPLLEHSHEAVSDRPPMIIERARAELTAQANGEAAYLRAEPSRLVGFTAGLSLSVVVGISLYFAL